MGGWVCMHSMFPGVCNFLISMVFFERLLALYVVTHLLHRICVSSHIIAARCR